MAGRWNGNYAKKLKDLEFFYSASPTRCVYTRHMYKYLFDAPSTSRTEVIQNIASSRTFTPDSARSTKSVQSVKSNFSINSKNSHHSKTSKHSHSSDVHVKKRVSELESKLNKEIEQRRKLEVELLAASNTLKKLESVVQKKDESLKA
jgi:hypothetical protein